jgi:hypothetical protein
VIKSNQSNGSSHSFHSKNIYHIQSVGNQYQTRVIFSSSIVGKSDESWMKIKRRNMKKICILGRLRYNAFCLRKKNSHKEDVSNNSKEKEPYEGSFSVIGTCGEVSVCPDLSLPERE